MENIADYYYNLLSDTTHPGTDLAKMYSDIFNIKLETKHYKLFNKLVRMYGRFNTFFAILQVAEMETVNHEKYLFPLFASIIKKRYEKRAGMANIESVDRAESTIRKLEREIKKIKKQTLNIPDIENEQ